MRDLSNTALLDELLDNLSDECLTWVWRELMNRPPEKAEHLEDRVEEHIHERGVSLRNLTEDMPAQEKQNDPVTIREAVEITGYAEQTLSKWCRDGMFPDAFQHGPGQKKRWYIPLKDLEEVIRPTHR